MVMVLLALVFLACVADAGAKRPTKAEILETELKVEAAKKAAVEGKQRANLLLKEQKEVANNVRASREVLVEAEKHKQELKNAADEAQTIQDNFSNTLKGLKETMAEKTKAAVFAEAVHKATAAAMDESEEQLVQVSEELELAKHKLEKYTALRGAVLDAASVAKTSTTGREVYKEKKELHEAVSQFKDLKKQKAKAIETMNELSEAEERLGKASVTKLRLEKAQAAYDKFQKEKGASDADVQETQAALRVATEAQAELASKVDESRKFAGEAARREEEIYQHIATLQSEMAASQNRGNAAEAA